MLKTSLRNLATHRSRTVATAVAVALGVAFLTGSLVLTDTVRVALDGTVDRTYAGIDVFLRGAPTRWSSTGLPRVSDRVAGVIGEKVEALTVGEIVAEKRGMSEAVTKAIRTLLLAFAAVAPFGGAFTIHNAFSILVAQRNRDVTCCSASRCSSP